MAHLTTGLNAPVEWIKFVLMDRFKWTPQETASISLDEGLQLLTLMKAEAKVAKAKRHG